jgi:hypothetical protein
MGYLPPNAQALIKLRYKIGLGLSMMQAVSTLIAAHFLFRLCYPAGYLF